MSIRTKSWHDRFPALLGGGVLGIALLASARPEPAYAQPLRPAEQVTPPKPANSVELFAGDRVVLLGDAFFAREHDLGYIETRLALQYPDRDVTLRNLGWLTNTALAGTAGTSEPPAAGLAQLQEQLAFIKPTVAIVGYGIDASASGDAGVPRFTTNFIRLLDTLRTAGGTTVRLVLLGPGQPEAAASPVTRGTLARYAAAIEDLAARRGARFVSLSNLMGELPHFSVTNGVTSDGLHLTPYGYKVVADLLASYLGWEPNIWRVGITRDAQFRRGGFGIRTADLESATNRIRFTGTLEQLPSPSVLQSNRPLPGLGSPGVIQFQGLAPTNHALKIDGQWVKTVSASTWRGGERIDSGPDFDQAEELRQAIVAKNELFRKRAQLGKSEDGAKLDPLIADAEKRIARLRKPVKRTYELVPAGLASTNAPPGR